MKKDQLYKRIKILEEEVRRKDVQTTKLVALTEDKGLQPVINTTPMPPVKLPKNPLPFKSAKNPPLTPSVKPPRKETDELAEIECPFCENWNLTKIEKDKK